jgi:predicted transport protein
VHPQAKKLPVHVKVDPAGIALEEHSTRDVSKLGHFGTGDLEITIGSPEALSEAQSSTDMSSEVS